MGDFQYISRITEEFLNERLNRSGGQRDVILVEGARQVGKTSLVGYLLKDRPHLWIDLEKKPGLRNRIDATKGFETFTDLLAAEFNFEPGKGQILVIDEAQESSQLGGYVRYMKENWRNQPVILMGSLMARLFRKGVRFPVGRVEPFRVYPFNFEEFLTALDESQVKSRIQEWSPKNPLTPPFHEKAMQLFAQYLQVGGLPEVVQLFAKKKNWQEKVESLSFGYSEDFKRVEGEERSGLFEICLKRVAQTLGSPSKLSTIVAAHQPGYRRVPDILNLLENWMLVYKVPVETPAAPATSKIPPKRYLFDHGIRQRMSPLSLKIPAMLEGGNPVLSSFLGGVLENAVLNEIKTVMSDQIVSWRKGMNSSEVDFLVNLQNRRIPVEVKAAAKTNSRFFVSLLHCLDFLGETIGILVNGDRGGIHDFSRKKILQVPYYAMTSTLSFLTRQGW